MAKTAQIPIRTTDEIKEVLIKKAAENGFPSLSEYIVFVALNAEVKVSVKKKENV